MTSRDASDELLELETRMAVMLAAIPAGPARVAAAAERGVREPVRLMLLEELAVRRRVPLRGGRCGGDAKAKRDLAQLAVQFASLPPEQRAAVTMQMQLHPLFAFLLEAIARENGVAPAGGSLGGGGGGGGDAGEDGDEAAAAGGGGGDGNGDGGEDGAGAGLDNSTPQTWSDRGWQILGSLPFLLPRAAFYLALPAVLLVAMRRRGMSVRDVVASLTRVPFD
jgi:hypothetical protein